MSLKDLQETMRAKATEAHAIVADEKLSRADKLLKLKGANPTANDGKGDGLDFEIKSLSEEIKEEQFLVTQRSQYAGLIDGQAQGAPPVAVKSIGAQIVENDPFQDALRQWKAGQQASTKAIVIEAPLGLKAAMLAEVRTKATLESGLGSANFIAQERIPGVVPILFERLTIADLMPSRPVTAPIVRVGVESTATNNAATVAEGGTKPASVLNWTVVDEPVRKVATINKVSDEFVEDVPAIQQEISGRLTLFVGLQEEAQILAGDGTGTNIVGILNRSGLTAAQAKGSDSVAVATHKEITKVRVASFLDPDAIVWHPNDWEGAVLETDANGQFYGPGPFTGPYGNGQVPGGTYAGSYWGLRSVVTTAMTQNTSLVGAFGVASELLRRSGISVVVSNVDQDDFSKNLMTVRAESRLGLRVIRPSAFGTVTGI